MKRLKKLAKYTYLPLLLIFAFLTVFFILTVLSKFVFVNKPLPVSEELISKRFADIFKERCENLVNWQDCYAEEFESFTKHHDIDLVFKTLQFSKELDYKVNDCHLMAHAISRAEVAKNYPNWHPYLAKIDSNDCNGGYIHGVVEALLVSDANFKLDKKGIEEICNAITDASSGKGEGACAHGVGHMVLVDNIGDMHKSIEVCSTIQQQLRYDCYAGVFMEDILRLTLVAHGIAEEIKPNWENTKAMESKCGQYSGEMRRACWREMAHFYTVIGSFDPEKIYNYCRRGKIGELIRTCYDHAILLMVLNTNFKDESWPKICKEERNGEKGYINCLSQVINAYISSSINFSPKVVSFCKSLSSGGSRLCCDMLNEHLGERQHEKVQCP